MCDKQEQDSPVNQYQTAKEYSMDKGYEGEKQKRYNIEEQISREIRDLSAKSGKYFDRITKLRNYQDLMTKYPEVHLMIQLWSELELR